MFINELFTKKSLPNASGVPTNENKYDDNLTITHRGNGYVVYHSFNRDAYTAQGTGEYRKQIQPEWFRSAADAMDHAEMEIDGDDGEHQGIK